MDSTKDNAETFLDEEYSESFIQNMIDEDFYYSQFNREVNCEEGEEY